MTVRGSVQAPVWRAFPYLEVLRPNIGQRVESALLASYSADPVVLVAALLALCDRAEDKPSRAAQVESLLSLRDRVAVLIQAGRLMAPRSPSPALKLLDRYVRFVDMDEGEKSWHPKVSWVMLDEPRECRVWIGSRNLTADRSWDLGLSLVGSLGDGGKVPEGLEELITLTAERAGLDVPDISGLKWHAPSGVEMMSLRLWESGVPRSLDLSPVADRILALSPFCDEQGLRAFEGMHHKTLVTTKETARSLGASYLSEWDRVLALAMPTFDAEPPDDDDEARPSTWALHAKAVLALCGEEVEVHMGSPNLTGRAWRNNVEALARFRTGQDWLEEIEALLALYATDVDVSALDEPESDPEVEAFERDLKRFVATVAFEQRREGGCSVITGEPFQVLRKDDAVSLRLFGETHAMEPWSPTDTKVTLPPSELSLFIEVHVRRGEATRKLVLCTALLGVIDDDRDERIMAKWLGLAGLFSWLRAILEDEEPGEPTWDDSAFTGTSDGQGAFEEILQQVVPTLEDVLKSWQRDPKRVERADREVQRFAQLASQHLESEHERRLLRKFEAQWETIVCGLGVRA